MKLSKWPGYPAKLDAEHQPDVRPYARRKYKLMSDWEFCVKTSYNQEYRFVIPEGFIHDGASVPRIAWTLSGLTPDGLIRAAALAHDWACKHNGRVTGEMSEHSERITRFPFPFQMSSADADRLFRDLMKVADMNWRSNVAYYAVRIAGPRW